MDKTKKVNIPFTTKDVEILKDILTNKKQLAKTYKEKLKAILSS
ncbi:hypothetical protein C2W64_04055 [Brevibacillus laterosporus]|nr:hypothetical protein [Brevibacillus laterosporus]RAP29108.1 hypothetical protein C2W64_04055 [Brevibacillus laterosporus]